MIFQVSVRECSIWKECMWGNYVVVQNNRRRATTVVLTPPFCLSFDPDLFFCTPQVDNNGLIDFVLLFATPNVRVQWMSEIDTVRIYVTSNLRFPLPLAFLLFGGRLLHSFFLLATSCHHSRERFIVHHGADLHPNITSFAREASRAKKTRYIHGIKEQMSSHQTF